MDAVKDEFFNHKIKRSTLVINELQKMPAKLCSNPSGKMNERFHVLMTNRMYRLIVVLNLLLNLTNRAHYKFFNSDVKQIFGYLDKVFDATLSHFIGIGDFSIKKLGEEAVVDGARVKR